MQTSIFAPPGLFKLAAGPPTAEVLHATIVRLFSEGTGLDLSTDLGSFVDCFAFALARVFARIQTRQEQLDGERLAAGAYELLPALEEEFGVVPPFGATLKERREALAIAMRVLLGSRRSELEQSLRDLLGDDYIGLHIQDPASEVSIWPSNLGDSPMLLAVPDAPRKVVRLPYAISTGLGSPQIITYEAVDPIVGEDGDNTLSVGDQIVVGVDNLGSAETVTVLAVGQTGEDGPLFFQATVNNAHDPGAICAAMPLPAWGSSQRHVFVVVSATAALDPDTRRRTHELMARTVTGVTTWSICPASGAAQAGPWTLDDPVLSRLDCNPMGTVSVP